MLLSFAEMHAKDYAPWVLTQDFITVRKLARRLSSIDTHACNGTKYTEDESYEKATKRVYKQLDALLSQHRINWYHQSDPRGAALYLSRQPMSNINYSNGVAIY